MERREFLLLLGALGMALPVSQAFANVPTMSPARRKLVIGVGSVGANILETFRNLPNFQQVGCKTLAVDWDDSNNSKFHNLPEYEKISLGSRPFDKWLTEQIIYIKHARLNEEFPAAILNVTPAFRDALSLIVVAGLGGGTGALIGPSLAQAAVNAGIQTLGIWVRPFSFEDKRCELYSWVVNQELTSHSTHYAPPNDYASRKLGGGITVRQAHDFLNLWIAKDIIMEEVLRDIKICPEETYPA